MSERARRESWSRTIEDTYTHTMIGSGKGRMFPHKKEKRFLTPPPIEIRCTYVHPNSERCGCRRMIGFELCYFHEPTIAQERREAQSRGGVNRGVVVITPPPTMESLEDVRQFAVETLHQVRTGEMEPRQAAVISSLMAHILKTLPELNAGEISAADQLRSLLSEESDVSEQEEDDEPSEPLQGDGSGEWEDHTVSIV